MTQCRTEKVDFWQNKNKQTQSKTESPKKNNSTGRVIRKKRTRKNKNKTKKQQKKAKPAFFLNLFSVFSCFFLLACYFLFDFSCFCFCCFLDLCFLVCFFGLLWFCFKKNYETLYSLCCWGHNAMSQRLNICHVSVLRLDQEIG